MADRKLVTHVMLREPGATSMSTFGPGDELPDWAEKMVEGKDHLFEAQDTADRARAVSQPRPAKRDLADKDYAPGIGPGREPAASEEGDSQLIDVDAVPEPPKGNASREAWALFAEHPAVGVPVTPDMGRDDIKDACIDAGYVEA
ncbi:hypothetical protein SEA_FLAPPER_34 [Gordonia phage Flapper]|uniref:Uncharacterized protein n=1 Tax=Gordonia phage Flapper TaxID=2079415 RepID=A0A2L1IX82_9CAUD|nr:head-tail connector protein [Gordonia phage Flapper]AVD99778.1 hypothetical protein SEA_FLAPPER_34 [Gordonia phage Flapper]